MDRIEVTRNGRTDQYSVVLTWGSDSIRCMVTVGLGDVPDARSDGEKHRAALSKAKSLAKALDEAIGDE